MTNLSLHGANKGSKRQIIEKMNGLKPEQLAAIEAQIAKMKSGPTCIQGV